MNLSYAIDRALWGAEPFGFHLTNVLLHMLNVALLFRVAWHVADDRRSSRPSDLRPAAPIIVAFAGASLFAVHPLMTEAVGYISGRSEVLCATFFLGALLCARRWMRGGGKVWWVATAGDVARGAPCQRDRRDVSGRSPVLRPVACRRRRRWHGAAGCCGSTCRSSRPRSGRERSASPSSSPWNIPATCRRSGCRFWTRSM